MLPDPIPIKPVSDALTPGHDGITAPRQAGGAPRFLTDVIVELRLVERDRVAAATEEARRVGKMPEDVLLEQGMEIRPAVTSREDISGLISRLTHLDDVVSEPDLHEDEESGPAEVVDLRGSADDAPVIRAASASMR